MRKLFIAVCIAFLVAACNTGNMENEKANPLIGTWECATDTSIETIQFTDNEFTSTYQSLAPVISEPTVFMQGTYQCYDNSIIIFRNDVGKFFADYSINANKLTMSFSNTGNTGIYTKKN